MCRLLIIPFFPVIAALIFIFVDPLLAGEHLTTSMIIVYGIAIFCFATVAGAISSSQRSNWAILIACIITYFLARYIYDLTSLFVISIATAIPAVIITLIDSRSTHM